jgi:predicted MFS family arabinose efflux permease
MTTSVPDAVPLESPRATNANRNYVLSVLIVVGAIAWVDRQILAIFLQSIKEEFSLSDTELGLLGGVAFGLFYVTVGVPVAWLADRVNRTYIVASSLAIWSVLTAACGLASGYWSLFFTRMGVGIGEAGAAAPSQSILSDYFPPERRAFAMGLLYSYMPISYIVAYGVGGWLNDAIGWRQAFVVVGLPGALIALLVRLTVREPARGDSERARVGPTPSPPKIGPALRYILSRPAMRRLPLAGAAHAIGMTATLVWVPTYFIRVHHMSSASIGLQLALILGITGLAGTLAGGHLADWLAKKTGDERWYAWICASAVLTTVPFLVIIFLARDPRLALALFLIPSLLNHTILGPVFATVQNLAGVTRRALAAACYIFVVNLLSMGLGPTLIGLVSDLAHARFGEDALRYSLLFLTATANVIAGSYFLLSARTLRQDLAMARSSAPLAV